MNDAGQPVVYIIACGAPPTREVVKLVEIARNDGWDVCVIASPMGRRFVDDDAISAKTGRTVRSNHKEPGTHDVLPPADAIIVAPATCNTMAKWAADISDTCRWACLSKRYAKRLPVVYLPFSKSRSTQFSRNPSGHEETC